jgi:dUTP pyrophosphatase
MNVKIGATMNLKFYKIRSNAKLPVRAHRTDAGMDLFYCPNGDRGPCMAEDGEYWIPARVSGLISTGLKTEIPEGYMLEIKNKSGIASKRQLVVGACVVDPGYDGEIYVNLHNIGADTQKIKPGDKIAQAVLVPVVHCGIEEAAEDDLNTGTTRGEGGFGSTGDR